MTSAMLANVMSILTATAAIAAAIICAGQWYVMRSQMSSTERQVKMLEKERAEREARAQVILDKLLKALRGYSSEWVNLDYSPGECGGFNEGFQFHPHIQPAFDPTGLGLPSDEVLLEACAVAAPEKISDASTALDRLRVWQSVYTDFISHGRPSLRFPDFESAQVYLNHPLRRQMSMALKAVIDSAMRLESGQGFAGFRPDR